MHKKSRIGTTLFTSSDSAMFGVGPTSTPTPAIFGVVVSTPTPSSESESVFVKYVINLNKMLSYY